MTAFCLSKGHAALVQYAALALAGYFPMEELKNVKSLGGMLQGHPDMTRTPGVEANTGSLGQGLSVANGMALGLRLNGSKSRVYVIIGDGEQNEGQIWEAAMAAASFKLDNLTAIVDRNRLQATGAIADRFEIGPLAPKWAAFGWNVIEIDGHDITRRGRGARCGRNGQRKTHRHHRQHGQGQRHFLRGKQRRLS